MTEDRSCDVTQYSVEMREEVDSDYLAVAKVSNRVTSYTVEQLNRGRLYRFRVRSKNAAGYSQAAAELESPVQLKEGTLVFFTARCVCIARTMLSSQARLKVKRYSYTSELRNITCHMGSHSVTCHPTRVNVPRLTRAIYLFIYLILIIMNKQITTNA